MKNSKRQETAQSIASLLPHIVQGVHFGVLASGSITQTQFMLVVYLHVHGSCPMSSLADHLKVRLPTVTGLVDRLVQVNFIKRQPHPSDRRQVLIELTPKARTFLKNFMTMYAKRWEEILLILNPQEIEQMLVITNKLNEGLKNKK